MSTLDQDRFDRIEARLAESEAKKEAVLGELVEARRSIAGLKSALAQAHEDDVVAPLVSHAFDKWRLLCRHPKAKLGPKRRELLAKALKRHGLDEVVRAIRGVARYPFVVDAARRSQGASAQRHDGLELICRDETTVEKFARLAWRADLEDGVILPGKCPRSVDVLADRFGWGEMVEMLDADYAPIGGLAEWWSPCPSCGSAGPTVRIRWSAGPFGELCCVAGCSQADVERAVEALVPAEERVA